MRIQQLEEKLKLFESGTTDAQRSAAVQEQELLDGTFALPPLDRCESLSLADIRRYSRQLLMPEVGVEGQRRLREASVLVVGAGGLGAPAALYLAGAGFGRIGLVDYDAVELDNLHRQVIHSERTLGVSKSVSAKEAVNRLNSSVHCVAYDVLLSSKNALAVIRPYDLVLDCTDNVATRYLLNDACVLAAKPLVSGSALRMEGQLTVYNYKGGPCYRCLFPKPPPPETVTRCSDGGVLGAVPGVIGCLQALEAVKLVTGKGNPLSGRLLLYSAMDAQFRTVKLRSRNAACVVCGDAPSITELIDYEQFCRSSAHDRHEDRKIDILGEERHISCEAYSQLARDGAPHLLLDVRSEEEFAICSLPNSLHIPLRQLSERVDTVVGQAAQSPVYVVCRRGNDSQRAVSLLGERGFVGAKNIQGGLLEWARTIDPAFPIY